MHEETLYDIAVIGAGPAGAQAAISAAHQMRHVIVFDAGAVSQRKGRAYWSKSVEFEDAPVFAGITGPKLLKELHAWLGARPVTVQPTGLGERPVGIELRGGVVMDIERRDDAFELAVSTQALRPGQDVQLEAFRARRIVVASGFEDRWPDIEVERSAERWMHRYRTAFRYAGNGHGWHVCIRCDGHLHAGQHMALLGTGDYIYEAAMGAQDFTRHLTILTNGRPHGMSDAVLRQALERDIEIVEKRIVAHIGQGVNLTGVRFEDGTERYFDGFLVDEGLDPNSGFLSRFEIATNDEGLLRVDDDAQVIDQSGLPIPGLFAAGDIVAGHRKLIASALASGQDAGLSASDSLRRFSWPE